MEDENKNEESTMNQRLHNQAAAAVATLQHGQSL
jgi:hypothetical protein